MVQRDVMVRNSLGIHARPASMIVQTAKSFKSEVWIEKDGMCADAKSIMSVMMLAAAQNSSVCLRAKGPDEKDALEAIARFFENNFNEE